MQIIQLHYFCTVARYNNMSRAADELWISQSALSKAISSLEEELGVKLFERVGRSIRLNEAGHLYYHQISHVLLLLNDAARQVRLLEKKNENEIRVLFSAANFISAYVREEFEHAFPGSQLLIKSCYAPTPEDILECDFHIFASPFICAEMTNIEMLKEDLVLAIGRKHPLAEKENVDLIDTKHYFFQSLPIQENLYENLISSCQKLGFEPNIGFYTEDSFTFFDGLISSSLIALVPSHTAFPALAHDIILREIKNPICQRTVYLGYHNDREMSANGLKFKSFCVDLFKRLGKPMSNEED